MLNKYSTQYFDCPIDIKQGNFLSPTLFAIFINNLSLEIKESLHGLKIEIGKDMSVLVNILLYADDIVLLTSNELDMQHLLSILESWCKKWRLELNLAKTNVMHVRCRNQSQSKFWFLFDRKTVPYCSNYRYLGTTIDQYLDYKVTSNVQCDVIPIHDKNQVRSTSTPTFVTSIHVMKP